MNTAELPKLRESPVPQAIPPAPRMANSAPRHRWQALEAVKAEGTWYAFKYYDVVAAPGRAWIAQSDWLPEPGGCDPVADEWPQVVSLVENLGYWLGLEEPFYDRVTGVWVWLIQRS